MNSKENLIKELEDRMKKNKSLYYETKDDIYLQRNSSLAKRIMELEKE